VLKRGADSVPGASAALRATRSARAGAECVRDPASFDVQHASQEAAFRVLRAAITSRGIDRAAFLALLDHGRGWPSHWPPLVLPQPEPKPEMRPTGRRRVAAVVILRAAAEQLHMHDRSIVARHLARMIAGSRHINVGVRR